MLKHVDELVLINDSVVGPMTDLRAVFSQLQKSNADIVGLTDSFEKEYHLQSYFLRFDRDLANSPELASFFAGYSFSSDKDKVIEQGELGLSRKFKSSGCRLQAIFPYEEVAGRWLKNVPRLTAEIDRLPDAAPRGDSNRSSAACYKQKLHQTLNDILDRVINGEPLNPTHFFWDTLIEDFAHPFLKRELISKNPGAIPSYFRIGSVIGRAQRSFLEAFADMLRQSGTFRMPFLESHGPSDHAALAQPYSNGTRHRSRHAGSEAAPSLRSAS
jgi:hypothetical protein